MPSDYDKIRDDNILEYGRGTRHLSFLGRLYTDRTHFIFELLQNAEDAGASRILFKLFDDRLEVTHDGRLFNERDVRGVCGVGEGTKAEDLTQIGKFGIGFKSVYAYTSTPEVHSGDESFKIDNYVRPFHVQPKKAGDSWTTLFIFPFNLESIDQETACREIGSRLRHLSARTLLFLRKIVEIGYKLPDLTGGVYLREEIAQGTARRLNVIGQNKGKDEDETWLIFERPVSVPDGSCQVCVAIGFQLETKAKDKSSESIARIKDAPLVVYFPTEKATRFGFLIQGPYRTTPSRDNIPKDDAWNSTLVKETAYLLTDMLLYLKQLGLLTVSLLEALPIRSDDFPEDSMFYPIVTAVREALMTEDLLPADDGTFVSASNSKLARGADLRSLLNNDQLQLLSQSVNTIKWLTGEITQDRTPDLRSYLMNELHVEEITPDSFARKINQSFLLNQTDEWFIEFYKYLLGQEALWRFPRWSGDTAGPLRSKAILRLQDDSQMVPYRGNGTTPNAFLPPPEETDFPIVKRSILNDDQAREFLGKKRLGLTEPDVFDDIVQRVLPKYSRTDISVISIDEHANDIQKILRAITSDSETGKKKVLQAARETPFLKAIDSHSAISFRKAEDVYMNSEDIRLYFSDFADVWFLDEQPPPSSTYSDVWRDLGVAHIPRRILFSGGLPPEEREYSTRGHTIDNYDLHGLDHFLNNLVMSKDFEQQKKLSLMLWQFLKEHLELDPRFFKGRYQWFYWSSHSKQFNSLMLKRLQNAVWIPTKDGISKKTIDISSDQLLNEYLGDIELIDILGIKRVILTEEEKKREHANELGVALEDIEFLKNHSPEFMQWKSLITARNVKPMFPTRTVTNPERRQERLEEQLVDAPKKEYERRERSVRVTGGAIDKSLWLREQYTNELGQMVCQICKNEMPFKKRDGEYYFEAVATLSKDLFPLEHEAQYLALCPLCAAMYKEFIINNEEAMKDLKTTILNMDQLEIPLRLGESDKTIRFVDTHYHDIKTILEKDAL